MRMRLVCGCVLLCMACAAGFAQERVAKFLIEGLFFSEAPSDLDGQRYNASLLKKDGGGTMLLVTGIALSDKAKTYAIPLSEVSDADYWLRQAEQAEGFMQVLAQAPAELALKEGDRICSFRVTDIGGKVWTDRTTQGWPLVLNFWYTGCGPCIKEMPELSTWVDACPDVNFLAVTWNTADEIRPVVRRRGFRFGGSMASRMASAFSGKSAVSVRVPGVMIRETLRSIEPFFCGWPTCSTITTLSPMRTRRAMYWSSDTIGMPAMGIGSPFKSVPREVSVIPKSLLARTASSKNVS